MALRFANDVNDDSCVDAPNSTLLVVLVLFGADEAAVVGVLLCERVDPEAATDVLVDVEDGAREMDVPVEATVVDVEVDEVVAAGALRAAALREAAAAAG